MVAIPLKNIKEKRNLPFLKRGMKVEVNGEIGVICSGNTCLNLNVRFEGQNFTQNVHPYWEIRYFDKDDKVLADFRENKN